MMRRVWVPIALAVACNRPLFPLFPDDKVYVAPTPSVPAMQPPAQLPAQRPQRPECKLTTPITELHTFYGTLPVGTGEADAYNAALQFLVTSGNTIAAQDPGAHTIVTNRLDGQTWLATCPVNHYFVYALHIAVAGSTMIVDMECWTSVGWEAGLFEGLWHDRNRGELGACAPKYVSENDAKIPSMIFEGAMTLLRVRAGGAAANPASWH